MKIIATADWHIHEFADFSRILNVEWNQTSMRFVESEETTAKPMNSRLFHILNGICDIRDYAKTNGITTVLNAGDVFHKRGSVSVTAFNAAYRVIESFHRLGITIYIIAGNHDQVDSSVSPESSIHTFGDIAYIAESPRIVEIAHGMDTVNLVMIPHSRDKAYIKSKIHEATLQVNPKESILMAHLGVTGGTVGSGVFMMSDEYGLPDLEYNRWKYVVLGHYHQPQLLEYNSIYAGTPVQNTFNDELYDDHPGGGFNGFFVLDTNVDPAVDESAIQFVPIIAPRFITVHSSDQLESVMQLHGGGNYYRLKVNQEQSEMVQATENVRVEVEKTYELATRSDIGLNDSLQDAVKKFAAENYKGDNPNVLPTGLTILNSVLIGGGTDEV